jgi:adenosine/AMP kinase
MFSCPKIDAWRVALFRLASYSVYAIKCMLTFHAVKLAIPENTNIVLGQSHFIKTVEDLYEAMVNTVPGAKFGIAFNEASGPCLIRSDGTDNALRLAAVEIASSVGAGHFFAVVMRDAFPINVLRSIQLMPEVCNIYCATANPVEVIVAETEQGRGVMGVIDGSRPKSPESPEDITHRHDFLRKIGYKR